MEEKFRKPTRGDTERKREQAEIPQMVSARGGFRADRSDPFEAGKDEPHPLRRVREQGEHSGKGDFARLENAPTAPRAMLRSARDGGVSDGQQAREDMASHKLLLHGVQISGGESQAPSLVVGPTTPQNRALQTFNPPTGPRRQTSNRKRVAYHDTVGANSSELRSVQSSASTEFTATGSAGVGSSRTSLEGRSAASYEELSSVLRDSGRATYPVVNSQDVVAVSQLAISSKRKVSRAPQHLQANSQMKKAVVKTLPPDIGAPIEADNERAQSSSLIQPSVNNLSVDHDTRDKVEDKRHGFPKLSSQADGSWQSDFSPASLRNIIKPDGLVQSGVTDTQVADQTSQVRSWSSVTSMPPSRTNLQSSLQESWSIRGSTSGRVPNPLSTRPPLLSSLKITEARNAAVNAIHYRDSPTSHPTSTTNGDLSDQTTRLAPNAPARNTAKASPIPFPIPLPHRTLHTDTWMGHNPVNESWMQQSRIDGSRESEKGLELDWREEARRKRAWEAAEYTELRERESKRVRHEATETQLREAAKYTQFTDQKRMTKMNDVARDVKVSVDRTARLADSEDNRFVVEFRGHSGANFADQTHAGEEKELSTRRSPPQNRYDNIKIDKDTGKEAETRGAGRAIINKPQSTLRPKWARLPERTTTSGVIENDPKSESKKTENKTPGKLQKVKQLAEGEKLKAERTGKECQSKEEVEIDKKALEIMKGFELRMAQHHVTPAVQLRAWEEDSKSEMMRESEMHIEVETWRTSK